MVSRDSISEMLNKLNWCPLKTRRKQSRLLLLFKLLNRSVHITDSILPTFRPYGTTRASHSIQLLRPFARTNVYLNSFFPRTIFDWNNLQIATLNNVSVVVFKNFLANLFGIVN